MRRAAVLACLAGAAACSDPDPLFSADPIPLELVAGEGGLLGIGTAADRVQPFPMLIDTGSPITAYSDGAQIVRATRGDLQLFGTDGTLRVPRLLLRDVQLFVTALGGTGLDLSSPISGVLGGDNLRRFVLSLAYTPTPQVQLTDALVLDDCDLSERCAAVLPFSVQGGHQLIDIGEDIYGYPASYVLLDACVEPALDPLEAGLTCSSPEDCNTVEACGGIPSCEAAVRDCRADADRYSAHGINVRLAVATGFPGLALTAAAYDRLRGRGSAAELMSGAPHTLFLPDQPIDAGGQRVGVGRLGLAPTGPHDGKARSAIALVGRTGYFWACEELARSRRLRKSPPEQPSTNPQEARCLRTARNNPDDPIIRSCVETTNGGGVCDDDSTEAHTAAYVEFEGTVPVIIVPDTNSLLQNINADVRPESATVEGVIGTELLKRMGTTIDYPGGRVVTTSAETSTVAFPQFGHGTDCKYPSAGRAFGGTSMRVFPLGGGCTPGSP